MADWLARAQARLAGAGVPSARLDAELLLCHATAQQRTWLHAHSDEPLAPHVLAAANAMLTRRTQREPLAYVVGYKEFYGREFTVTPDVLIPRPESETILELLLTAGLPAAPHIIDVGTGSGVLGITAALELPGSQVTLLDISPAARAVAAANARRHGAQVRMLHSDLLADYPLELPPADAILANLPYVDESWPDTSPELAYEPRLALYANQGGYELILRLLHEAAAVLQPGGILLLEADARQHSTIRAYAQRTGWQPGPIQGLIIPLTRRAPSAP